MTVHLDISQLLIDPRRSGIQRAERELIRHWPGPAPLVPCLFDAAANALRELPDTMLAALSEDPAPGSIAAELERLAPHRRPGHTVTPDRLLNAELFLDPARAAYYRRRPPHVHAFWLVYDFLPWLHPAWFPPGSIAACMPYLRALRTVPNVAYISERTRTDHATRIGRRPSAGPVIPMGGDGLHLEPQHFDPARRGFVMLGGIEPRKNAAAAMLAFRSLWREGVDATLTLIGTPDPDAAAELALLAELATEPRFQHRQDVPDSDVRDALRTARALLFPSEGEGFGIPPVEALHAGIPVIISTSLPALENQPPLGQLRLDTVTPETIAAAVRTMLDDTQARGLWDGAARLPVPRWVDYAARLAAWVQS